MLLSSEMDQNATVLDAYRKNPELLRREQAGSLQSEVWESAKTRVAQIAHPMVVARLLSYYRSLRKVRQLAAGWESEDDSFISPTVVFDQLEFAEKDPNRAIDEHMPLPLSHPIDAIFSWEERRSKRSGK